MANKIILLQDGKYVTLTGTATGQIPTWNNTLGVWQLGTGGGGGGIVTIDYELFVSKNGTPSGDGSLSSPFDTITAALTAAGAIAQANIVRINIAPGSYVEDLTITRSNLILAGACDSPEERATKILGSVTVNVTTATGVFANLIEISGVYISKTGATPVTFTGTQACSLTLLNSYITSGSGAYSVVKHNNTGAADGYASRLVLRNCVIAKASSQSVPIIALERGDTQIDTVRVYGPSGAASGGEGILLSNSATLTADRLLVEHYAPAAGIAVTTSTPGVSRLILSNSAVTTRYAAATTAPAISLSNSVSTLWQNLLTVSNASAKAVAGTGLLAATFCYYGQLTYGPSATGAVYGSLDTSLVTFVPMSETHGNMTLPALTASQPLRLGATKEVTTGQINLASEVTGTLPAGNQADQSMGGDVGGTTGAATVTGLQSRPVSATAPTSGQVLGWSGSAWAPVTVTSGGGGGGGGGGGYTYYLNYTNSGEAPVPTVGAKQLSFDFDDVTPSTNTGAISVNQNTDPTPYTVLAQFVTDVGDPGTTTIPPGIWEMAVYALANAATNAYIRFRLSKWDGSTLTDITTPSDYVEVTHTTVPAARFDISLYVPATALASNERLVITLEGTRDVSTARTITAYFEGNTVSHVHTTFSAPGGTGLVKVFDGVVQDPASLLVNADVAAAAAIVVSKLDGNTGGGSSAKFLRGSDGLAAPPTWEAVPIAYDVSSQISGKPPASTTVYFKAVRAFTLSATSSNHVFTANTAAAATAVFTVYRNNDVILTATFAASATVATISAVANNSIAVGDVIRVVAPSVQDVSLADVYWTLWGTL